MPSNYQYVGPLKFQLESVKTIIFDLGGVVLNLDIPKTIEAFAKIGHVDVADIIETFDNHPIFHAFERGEISAKTFREEINDLLDPDVSDNDIDAAWNAMLLDLPLDRINMLGSLRDDYQTIVLSNTNQIHLSAFDKTVRQVTNGKVLQDYFDHVYYSHELGLRKPDPAIFEYVLAKHNCVPSETLFIDDMESNIHAAAAMGLQTWHMKDQQELTEVFKVDG